MFCVIYSFKVNPGREQDFEQAWKELTLLIRRFEGGLGSRLHKQSDTEYIAYAQWPDRETWEGAGDKLPGSAEVIRKSMRNVCESISTLHELEVVEDLLVTSNKRRTTS